VNFLSSSSSFDCLSAPNVQIALANALQNVADITCNAGAGHCGNHSVMDEKARVIQYILNHTHLGGKDCSMFTSTCECSLALSASQTLGRSSLLLNVDWLIEYVEHIVLQRASTAVLAAIFPALNSHSATFLPFVLSKIKEMLPHTVNDMLDFNFVLTLINSLGSVRSTVSLGLLKEIIEAKGLFPVSQNVCNGSMQLLNAASNSFNLITSNSTCK